MTEMVPWRAWADSSQLANDENEPIILFIQWMITGTHIVIFSNDPEIDRAFLRDVLHESVCIAVKSITPGLRILLNRPWSDNPRVSPNPSFSHPNLVLNP